MINKLIILLVRVYQNTFSFFFPCSCKFYPSCSQYMIDSLNKYGTFMGIFYGIRRLSRCHPLSRYSGSDPA